MTPAPLHFECGDLLVATESAQGLRRNVVYLVLEVLDRGFGTVVVVENEESEEGLVRLAIEGAGDLFWVMEPEDGEPRCQWCGEVAAEGHPLEETVVSPPVDGFRVETVCCHPECAGEWATSLVR